MRTCQNFRWPYTYVHETNQVSACSTNLDKAFTCSSFIRATCDDATQNIWSQWNHNSTNLNRGGTWGNDVSFSKLPSHHLTKMTSLSLASRSTYLSDVSGFLRVQPCSHSHVKCMRQRRTSAARHRLQTPPGHGDGLRWRKKHLCSVSLFENNR